MPGPTPPIAGGRGIAEFKSASPGLLYSISLKENRGPGGGPALTCLLLSFGVPSCIYRNELRRLDTERNGIVGYGGRPPG